MARRIPLVLVLVLAAAACSYESSGTTTTTLAPVTEDTVPTGPADIVASDQRSEGSSVLVDSLSMPAPGWVVARLDAGGSPGEVIGVSELVSKGVTSAVSVPFLVPVAGTTTVHLTIHIDVDADGEFRYEPPDSFIDQIATEASGTPATTTVTITLLPPLGPGSAVIEAQVSDGTAVVVTGAVLPAAGFLALHQSENDAPGTVLAVSGLLPAGEVGESTLAPESPLAGSGTLFVVAWVDRDENGEFTPGIDGDEMAVREDGSLAASSAVVTVLRLEPAALVVDDQETDRESFVVAALEMPSPGFIEILADDAGDPGARLAVIATDAGTFDDLEIALPDDAATGARLWLRLWVDFDQSGDLSTGDRLALTELDGDPIETSFVITIVP